MEHRGWRPPVPEQARGGQENKEANVPTVPENEIELEFVRSSGPGGQNVNKTSSKAQLRWNVGRSRVFTEEQKAQIRAYAGNRLTGEDEILMSSQTERSQAQNRDEVVERLQELVAEALTPQAERKETKVSYSQKQKRLEDKRHESERKKDRKPPRGGW